MSTVAVLAAGGCPVSRALDGTGLLPPFPARMLNALTETTCIGPMPHPCFRAALAGCEKLEFTPHPPEWDAA